MRNTSDRSIRNIPVSASHRHMPGVPPKRRRRVGRFFFLALIVIAVFGAIGTAISLVFAGVTIDVQSHTAEIAPPPTLTAMLNAPVGTLSFQTITQTQSATTTVPATGTSRVSKQATGSVVITSTYSKSQRLIANTRLEAPDGKIYRLMGSVTVPAGGSVVATIQADSPGSDYNRSGTTSFTIPNFKGDPRYARFSAKSSGPISGGFVGEQPSVAAADLAAAKQRLQQQLGSTIELAISKSVSEDFSPIPGALAISYGDVIESVGGDKTATLSQNAIGTGGIVRINDLATALARAGVKGYGGEAVTFADLSALDIALASTSKPTDETITLNLSGSATLVWIFDPNALKQALLGKQKSQFQTVIQSFAPAIERADATVRPFWTTAFPNDSDKITIKVESAK